MSSRSILWHLNFPSGPIAYTYMPRKTTYAVLHLKVEIQNNSRTYTRPPYFVNISFKIFVYQFTLNVF